MKTKSTILIKTFCSLVIMLPFVNAHAQEDTLNLDDLSLKDLLNVKIVSVSKTSEYLFDAALSASVLTKEQLMRSGCTSIMEALRLVPGMIVREQSNGNYDIHLRGMDNVPPDAPFELTSNTTTLVMIDNRPVYSYFRGGTFWETLPIDINDVEKIEVVRGPAAALYGSNAVNGVINIITRGVTKDGLYAVANLRQGSYHTAVHNASVGYRFKKWSMIASGNYQQRNRTQTTYFEFNRHRSFDNPEYYLNFLNDTIRNFNEINPVPEQAMKKYAGNIFLAYEVKDKIQLNFSAGLQHSLAQKVLTENDITPLTTIESDSRYIDFRAVVKGLSAQVSYNGGTQVKAYLAGNKYDFSIVDVSVEYNYVKGNFSLKPGVSYRNAAYDDTKYSDIVSKTGIFNAKGLITTQSASLRADYKLPDTKLKLVAGITASKFNYPDTTYLSYQFAATYNLNKTHLLRAVYSSAPRSSTIYETYVHQIRASFPAGYRKYIHLSVEGNKNLKLLTADMLEFGYRGRITSRINIDAELFGIRAKNYNAFVQNRSTITLEGVDTIETRPVIAMNIPITLHQQGITISLTYSSKKLQIHPFITFQQTKMKNYAPYLNTPDVASTHIYSGIGAESIFKGTPAIYGGAVVNYSLSSKVNLDVTAYYYSSQTHSHVSNIVFNDGIRGIDHLKAKLILNANVTYQPVKQFNLFCSVKNILNNKEREFLRTDDTPIMLLAGANYQFK